MTKPDYRAFADAHCRLIILRALSEEFDYALGEVLLMHHLELHGHNRTRESLRAQIRWLEESGAVSVKEFDGYLIADLKQRGRDHVEGRAVIDGVHRPGPGE